ncbi:MAG: hypothetical protein HUJ74_02215 [Lachnospiraceae bacterium]|nr:hypothetical protein [Lachnospiraceae bacterium]
MLPYTLRLGTWLLERKKRYGCYVSVETATTKGAEISGWYSQRLLKWLLSRRFGNCLLEKLD